MSFDLQEFKDKKVHIIGIGGSMMSGIAGILLENGINVSGSDRHESKALDKVRRQGASVKGAHHEDNIYDQDLVIYTAAIGEDNPELVAAKEKGIPTMTRSVFLGHLLKNFQYSIGVAGTHGKTSTTAMLSAMTMETGYDPTVLVGATIPALNSNYRVGQSEIMIVESCEYKKSFLDFPPHIAILLNLEEDHVDVYKDLDAVKDAFASYVTSVPADGTIVANADDEDVMAVAEKASAKVMTFGIEAGDIRAGNITVDDSGKAAFTVTQNEAPLFDIHLPVPGTFNVYNALAAITACLAIGMKPQDIKEGLSAYGGVDRRMQELGTINGIRFIDDYGHHPTEVKMTMETILHYDYDKLFVVEQPHTFSRLNRFFDDFLPLFDGADYLLLLPVFAAREKDTGLTSSDKLGDAIRARKTVDCVNVQDYEEAANFILGRARPGDLVLLIGAGEGYKVYDLIKANEAFCKDHCKR